MALPDPRTGGCFIKCISNKLVCIAVGWFQVVSWAIGTIIIMFNPSSVFLIASEVTTLQHVLGVLLGLACFGFCLQFVYGLHKDRKLLVKIYIIYVVVYVTNIIGAFIFILCTQPKSLGFKYFFITVFEVVFHALCFFIARGYYLMTYCNNNQETGKNNQISV